MLIFGCLWVTFYFSPLFTISKLFKIVIHVRHPPSFSAVFIIFTVFVKLLALALNNLVLDLANLITSLAKPGH